jgi:hypothetical protein
MYVTAPGFQEIFEQNPQDPPSDPKNDLLVQQQCYEQGVGPYVVQLPKGFGMDNPTETVVLPRRRVGDGDCMQLPQVMLEAQKTPVGLAGCGRLRMGPAVMSVENLQPGTMIASRWQRYRDTDIFYYPNAATGNHAAFYVGKLEGGFRVLEQVAGTVMLTNKTDTNGSYYSNPNAYHVVLTSDCLPGMPRRPGAGAPRRRRG